LPLIKGKCRFGLYFKVYIAIVVVIVLGSNQK